MQPHITLLNFEQVVIWKCYF